jgi:hypothetical protein
MVSVEASGLTLRWPEASRAQHFCWDHCQEVWAPDSTPVILSTRLQEQVEGWQGEPSALVQNRWSAGSGWTSHDR